MELRTVEVRWFAAGPCPDPVSEWFHAGPLVGEPEQRTDAYLRLPERDDLGVKRRGGTQLDLKLRTGLPTGVALPDGFDGRIEAWTKWSFPLDGEKVTEQEHSWIPVEKIRWTRRYELAGDGTAGAVPAALVLPTACAAELVEVRIGARHSWGFGFEAFAVDRDAGTVLEVACRALLADTPLGELAFTSRDAHSYPSWLQVWPGAR